MKLITFKNETKSLAGWAKSVGITRATLWARLNISKMPFKQAIRSGKYKPGRKKRK